MSRHVLPHDRFSMSRDDDDLGCILHLRYPLSSDQARHNLIGKLLSVLLQASPVSERRAAKIRKELLEMPTIRVNGVELYYEDTEKGDEIIVFSHGLLFSCRMFDDQVNYFRSRYRCIAYDHRGQGQSEIAKDGYDMETIYADGLALIDALKLPLVHFVGLSMGGFVGMRIGARRPELLKSLILLETSADPEPTENLSRYRLLQFIGRWLGPKYIVNGAVKILFGQKSLTDPAYADKLKLWKQRLGANHPVGASKAASGVLTRKSIYGEIAKITAPTLVMVGDMDVATVPAKAERIHQQIKGSQLLTIPRAGHSSSAETPDLVNRAIDDFLTSL